MQYYYPYPAPTPYYYQADPQRQMRKTIRQESNRSAWGVLLMIFAMSILYLLISWIIPAGGSEAIEQTEDCLYYIIGAFLPFFIMFQILKNKWDVNELIPFRAVSFGTALPLLLMGLGVCMVSNIPANIVASLCESFGFNASFPETPFPATWPGRILYFISISIIPALVEEFAFRGVILSRLRRFGDGFAIVATAFMFALFHGNVIQFVFTFLVGLYFAFVVVKTNNLLLSIILHAVNNGISVVLEAVTEYGGEDLANTVYLAIIIGAAVLGILSLILLLIRRRELFRSSRMPQQTSLGFRVGAFFSNPGVICLILYSIVSSVQFLTMDPSYYG